MFFLRNISIFNYLSSKKKIAQNSYLIEDVF